MPTASLCAVKQTIAGLLNSQDGIQYRFGEGGKPWFEIYGANRKMRRVMLPMPSHLTEQRVADTINEVKVAVAAIQAPDTALGAELHRHGLTPRPPRILPRRIEPRALPAEAEQPWIGHTPKNQEPPRDLVAAWKMIDELLVRIEALEARLAKH